MSHTPHDLAQDFPDQSEQISSLKLGNTHFANLADAYHTINRQVHRAETDVEPLGDDQMAELRRKRMHLKDQIAQMLREAT